MGKHVKIATTKYFRKINFGCIYVCDERLLGVGDGIILDKKMKVVFSLFLLPDYQGKGVGRMIIETLRKIIFPSSKE